jgi:hypothetical protein
MRVARRMFMTLAAAGMVAGGCASADRAPGEDRVPDVLVQVSNNHWSDVRVYAVVASGARQRLGLVNSFTEQTFRLPRHMLAVRGLRLEADPVGSSRTHTSPQLQVPPGGRVVWELENSLPLSSAYVLRR